MHISYRRSEKISAQKSLRRKGQGEKERPICPMCQQDLKRSYIREWNGKNSISEPTGWECKECKYKKWD